VPPDDPAEALTTAIPRLHDDTHTIPAVQHEPERARTGQNDPGLSPARLAAWGLWACVLTTEGVWLAAVVRAGLAVLHWY
jgi:hypothetical protein